MMTKVKFKKYLSEKYNISQVLAEEVINIVFDSIPEVTAKEGLKILGFGIFTSKFKGGQKKRNPQNGESIFVPEHRSPVFKAGSEFRRVVNK